MSSSYILAMSLLEDIVEKMVLADEEDSMELSFSSTPDHPLPCSADFQFFLSIAKTVPPHSPDSMSLSYSGVTPPSSQLWTPSPGRSSCTPSSPPPSPGVALLPLSGQITQAVMQESRNHDHEQGPAKKMIKLEAKERTDLLEDVSSLEEDEDDSADDEIPLTFTTPADLLWKLQKAEIIPPRSVFSNLREQRDRSRDTVEEHCMEEERTEKSFDEGSRIIRDEQGVIGSGDVFDKTVEIIKEEKEDVITDEVDFVVERKDDVLEEHDHSVNEEKTANTDNSASQRPPSMVYLLNKPPRLGLSKLYKSSTSLHDISIIEKGDKNVNRQRDLIIIEKEE